MTRSASLSTTRETEVLRAPMSARAVSSAVRTARRSSAALPTASLSICRDISTVGAVFSSMRGADINTRAVRGLPHALELTRHGSVPVLNQATRGPDSSEAATRWRITSCRRRPHCDPWHGPCANEHVTGRSSMKLTLWVLLASLLSAAPAAAKHWHEERKDSD